MIENQSEISFGDLIVWGQDQTESHELIEGTVVPVRAERPRIAVEVVSRPKSGRAWNANVFESANELQSSVEASALSGAARVSSGKA